MNSWPETESELLRRITDPVDDAAWNRFDALYRPVVYRYARLKGLQHSDAEILVGEVMARVFRAARRWSDSSPGENANDAVRPQHFRAWLRRVADNALLNLVTRQLARRGTGGTSHQLNLSNRPLPDDAAKQNWQHEHQRQLFAAAARIVQRQVDEEHLTVFWSTHVDGQAVADVAERTRRSVGSVYAIRRRIVRRLRQTVQRLESFRDADTGAPLP